MDPEFESLVLKVLEGTANAEETALLQRVIAEDPGKMEQWLELKEALRIARAIVPSLQALEAQTDKLPAYRLPELRAAVRRVFPQKFAEERAPFFSWRTIFRPAPAFMLSGACAAILGMLLWQSIWVGSGPVEFGSYAGYAVRGEQDALPSGLQRQVTVRTFEKEDEFSDWQKSGWNNHPKARIWFDDEKGVVHVLRPGGPLSRSVEVVYPLPEDPRQREELLRKIISGLQSGGTLSF
ncbi:MAG: hypothetical protein PHD76_10930 [Methylacidiphilales bacterium]|nr:hypothetical protein [Candidatus Methylacidiphilales bacterium]